MAVLKKIIMNCILKLHSNGFYQQIFLAIIVLKFLQMLVLDFPYIFSAIFIVPGKFQLAGRKIFTDKYIEHLKKWFQHMQLHVTPSNFFIRIIRSEALVNQGCQKVLSSSLIMNTCSRRLQNSHQRPKFLRAGISRDILKFRVSEIVFPGVFKRYFPLPMPCCFVGIHTRL